MCSQLQVMGLPKWGVPCQGLSGLLDHMGVHPKHFGVPVWAPQNDDERTLPYT